METMEPILDPRLFEVYYFEQHPEHNAAWDAVETGDGRAYIGLCNEGEPGLSAALYLFDPGQRDPRRRLRHLFDVDRVTHDDTRRGHIPQSKFHTAMAVGGDGKLYSVTHTTAPGYGRPFWAVSQDFYDPDYRYPGSHFIVYDPATEKAEDWGIPVPGESIYAGCLDWENRKYYMLTLTRGHLCVLDLNTGLTEDLGRFTRGWQCALFADRKGRLWSADLDGAFTFYDPATGRAERPGISMPRPAGRDHLWSFILPPAHWKDGKWVGTMQYESRLWLLDTEAPEGPTVRDLGMGWDEFRPERKVQDNLIWEPQFGQDGLLYYGVSAYTDSIYADSENQMRAGVRVIRRDMETGKRVKLGMVWADDRPAYVFASRFILPDGRIGWVDSCFTGKPARLILFDPSQTARFSTPSSQTRSTVTSIPQEEYRRLQQTTRRNRHAVDTLDLDRHHAKVVRVCGSGFDRGSCAVTALARAGGSVWGGVSGEQAALFTWDPRSGESAVRRNSELPGAVQVTSLSASGEAVVGTARGAVRAGYAFRADRRDGASILAHMPCGAQPMGAALQGDALYVLTDAGGLLRCGLCGEAPVEMARLEPAGLSPLLAAVGGVLFGCVQNGQLFAFDTARARLEVTDVFIPAPRGRQYDAIWQSAARRGERLAGGTSDGYVFDLDPVRMAVTNLGKALQGPGLPAMAACEDGTLFGAGGRPQGIAHVFRLSDDAGFEDLGILSNENGIWQGFCVGSMACGDDGTVYIGENDAIAHLWACSFG